MGEWYQAAQAAEIDTKMDAIHAYQLSQPAHDSQSRYAKQQALDKIVIKREMLLGYNRFTDSVEVKQAEKRGNAFLQEVERLYREAQLKQEEIKH